MRLVNTYEHALVAYLCVLLAAAPFVLWAQQGLRLGFAWLGGAALLAVLGMFGALGGLRKPLREQASLRDRIFCASAFVLAFLPLAGTLFMGYLIASNGSV